jgi:hypothetical protein
MRCCWLSVSCIQIGKKFEKSIAVSSFHSLVSILHGRREVNEKLPVGEMRSFGRLSIDR